MKAPGERVTLRVAFGDVPPSGVVLQMASGRRYWVWMAVGKTLHCRVMAPGEDVPAMCRAVIPWRWAGRVSSSRRRTGPPLAQLVWEHWSASQAGRV